MSTEFTVFVLDSAVVQEIEFEREQMYLEQIDLELEKKGLNPDDYICSLMMQEEVYEDDSVDPPMVYRGVVGVSAGVFKKTSDQVVLEQAYEKLVTILGEDEEEEFVPTDDNVLE